ETEGKFDPEIARRLRQQLAQELAYIRANKPGDRARILLEALGEPVQQGETINQAAEHWFAELGRSGIRSTTLDGHKLRVRPFVEHLGDLALTSVPRSMAADWLAKVAQGRSNRTTNAYSVTLKGLFASARQRGRFQGDNPFDGQKRKAVAESYSPFELVELH